MAAALTPGAVQQAKSGNCMDPITVKLTNLNRISDAKWSCTFTDGSATSLKGVLSSQVVKDISAGRLALGDGDVVCLQQYFCNFLKDDHILIASSISVVQAAPPCAAKQPPTTPVASSRGDVVAARDTDGKDGFGVLRPLANGAAAGRGVSTGMVTPGPAPSPSEELRVKPEPSPLPLSPIRAAPMPSPPVRASRPNVRPIAALNPYDTNWTIQAQVVHKAPARSFTKGTQTTRVFSAELADKEGGRIQATFWREAASKYEDMLQEGKVYYFSRFAVKPSNRAYATVRNDYEAHFDNRTEIEECADQGAVVAAVVVADPVPFEKLPSYVGRKMPVDVLGVVVGVGAPGTVKRRADNTELPRRDVTLADKSGRSVVLTLWNDNALNPDLDAADGRVMQVTSVRVGDYNGCSLSSVSRSVVVLDPDTADAHQLREWWEAEGRGSSLTPLGQAGGSGGGEGGRARNGRLSFLTDVVVSGDLPAPDAKPIYSNVVAAVAHINADRDMYYLANPENGRKVVPQDGRFWSEGDGRFVDVAQHRYVLSVKLSDASGELYINLFNQQAEQLLGVSADHLASLKEAGQEEEVRTVLKGAQWRQWLLAVAARSREYNGDRRMRYTAMQVYPLDFKAESQRLLAMIQELQQQA